ncbi:MAG TPA: CHAT domain-containing protein, partial [Thermoanaerobaculia bacterium]|nr:CHAT domain-containing protein [Thermoanaerobaculia bacterium]
AGQVVGQQGIDVAVSLKAADGKTVATIDSLNGILGPEPLPIVTETGGRFRLEVESSPAAPEGRYALRLEELRLAAARDRARVEAERTLAEGVGLYSKGTPENLRLALKKEAEALARFRALGLRDREAEALSSLGVTYDRLDERKAAIVAYRQALALLGALRDESRAGILLTNLGRLERLDGRYNVALALYRKALPLHRQSHNRPEEARTLDHMGRLAIDRGESGEAISAFEQALTLWRALGDRGGEGETLINLGRLEGSLGQAPRALDHLGRAEALLEVLGNHHGLGVALAEVGVARALGGRPRKEVLAAFQRALQLQRETKDRRWEAVTLNDLGWYYHREGEIHQAEGIFRQTLAIFQADNDRADEAGALINLGGIDLDLGQLAQAENSFTRAQALFAEIGEPNEEAKALFGLAQVRRATGRSSEALAAIEGASSLVEDLRRKPADTDLRMTFFANQQAIYELRVDLLVELHRDAQALKASEEARARTLLDLLARVDVRPAGSGILLSSQEIQAQVAEKGTLLLEYSLGEKRSFLWAVTPQSLESFELPPRKELEKDARSAAFLLAQSGRTLARGQAALALAGLARRLLGPVAHKLRKADRLVVVPDGALWGISFAALPDPAGGAPLVAGHEIVTLPSASALPQLRAAAAGRRPIAGTLAVLADPVFSANDPRVTPAPAVPTAAPEPGNSLAQFERLPFSRAEAQAILSVAPQQGRLAALDFDASRETVLSGRLAGFRILHFATHAVLNTENPELSGVVLSMVDPQGHPRDGFLRLTEIYRLHLPADLVVLSACRTALGQEIRGEGLVGLTRGFFSAGARQVLVSLWPVEDRATAELMRRFYSEMLGRGRSPAAALRAAQTAMWKDQGWRSAYNWAGFTLQGDWRVSPNRPPLPDL